MSFSVDRRDFLWRSAMLGGSFLTCCVPLDRSANAASVRIDVPVVDQLTVPGNYRQFARHLFVGCEGSGSSG